MIFASTDIPGGFATVSSLLQCSGITVASRFTSVSSLKTSLPLSEILSRQPFVSIDMCDISLQVHHNVLLSFENKFNFNRFLARSVAFEIFYTCGQ